MSSTTTPTADYAGVPLPEVQIITNRLLSAETTERVLNALDVISGIRQINMTGEASPRPSTAVPGRGSPTTTASARSSMSEDRRWSSATSSEGST